MKDKRELNDKRNRLVSETGLSQEQLEEGKDILLIEKENSIYIYQ